MCVNFGILGHVIVNWKTQRNTKKRRDLASKFINSLITQKPLDMKSEIWTQRAGCLRLLYANRV